MSKLPDEMLRALQSCQLLRDMPAAGLEAILSLAGERHVRRGATIFQRGDAGSSRMAIVAGSVRIGATSRDGKEVTLAVLGAGAVFGELALLDGKPRSADASALEDTRLIEIGRGAFLRLLREDNALLSALLALLCERVRSASASVEDMALLDVPTRLARVLLKLGVHYGRKTPAGLRIELRISQQDLSTLVAASREAVNRQLQTWREAGILGSDSGLHLIRQAARLAAYAEPL